MVEKQDFEALIVRYLEGTAVPEEAIQLEDWKNASSENQQLYEQYERLFSENRFQKLDSNAAWIKVSGEISQKTKVISIKNWRYWAVAAAAILVIALIVPTLMNSGRQIKPPVEPVADEKEESNTLYAMNGVKSFILEDNSSVDLVEGSSLELSKNFKNGERRSKLKGSGRFTVVHDETHPFIIDVEGLEVYDIGTVFDITTNKDTVKVVVLEGAVELRKDGQILAMEEGDSAFYLIGQRLIQEYPLELGQDNLTIRFDDQELENVVKIIANYFNESIVIMDEDIKSKTITISFTNASLAEALSVLEPIADIKAIRKSNQIEIYDEN
ncbi:FecR domain-containing protein [Crocinitomicaceae bacterium]|nr:FecR domain-containing protein [Crocinitomicaceae bacterium]